jgi:hypothetical protein
LLKPTPPPYPEYRTQRVENPTEYRVVFWTHQKLPGGDGDAGWSELTIDLIDVADVQEALRWAEEHLVDHVDPQIHSEATYALYVRVPGQELFLHLVGRDPTLGDLQ